MRPLHIRLVVGDPQGEDVGMLRDALQAAGHIIVAEEASNMPPGVAAVPDFVITDGAAMPTPESLDAAESRHIAAVLQFTGGNRRQAALLLGVARSTLLAKVRKYHLG